MRTDGKRASIEAGKPVKWFCNQVRDDSGSHQNRVIAEKVVGSGQSAPIFKTEPSVFPGGIHVGYKRKGEQSSMPRFWAYTTGRMELPSTGTSTKTHTRAIRVNKEGRDKK